MTTQPQTSQPKLSQCKRCSEKGFQNVMIYFVQNGFNKSTGKPFWDLKNQDGSPHVHLSPLNPTIPTQTTPATTTQPTATTNGTTKEQVIQQLHDRRVETELLHIQAINNQTTVLKTLADSIRLLVVSLNNRAK